MQKPNFGANQLFKIKVNKQNKIYTSIENDNNKFKSNIIDFDFRFKNHMLSPKFLNNSIINNKIRKNRAIRSNKVFDNIKLINNFNTDFLYKTKSFAKNFRIKTPLKKNSNFQKINSNSIHNYSNTDKYNGLLNKYLYKLLEQFIKYIKKAFLSSIKFIFYKMKNFNNEKTFVNSKNNRKSMNMEKSKRIISSSHFILKFSNNSLSNQLDYEQKCCGNSFCLNNNKNTFNNNNYSFNNLKSFGHMNKTQSEFDQINCRKINEIKINKCDPLNKHKQNIENLRLKIVNANNQIKKIKYISTNFSFRNSNHVRGTNYKTGFSANENSFKNTISTKNKTTIYYKNSPSFQINSKLIDDEGNTNKILQNNFKENKNKKTYKRETRLYFCPNYTENEKININSLIINTNKCKEKYKLFQKNFMENLDKSYLNNKNKEKNAKNEKKIYISKIIKNIKTKDGRLNIRINYIFYFPNKAIKNKNTLLKTQSEFSFVYINQKQKLNLGQSKIYRKKVLCSINEDEKKTKLNFSNNYNKHSYNNIIKLIKTVNKVYTNMFKKRFIKNLNIINFIIKYYIFEKLIKIHYFNKVCSILNQVIKIQNNSSNHVNENIERKPNKSSSYSESGDSSDFVLSLNKDTIMDHKFLTSISELNNNINHNIEK